MSKKPTTAQPAENTSNSILALVTLACLRSSSKAPAIISRVKVALRLNNADDKALETLRSALLTKDAHKQIVKWLELPTYAKDYFIESIDPIDGICVVNVEPKK